jgi:hypothetical protein
MHPAYIDKTFASHFGLAILKIVQRSQSPLRSVPGLNEIQRDSNHVVLSYSNVLLVLWQGRQDPLVCDRLYDLAVDLANKTGTGKVAAISIIQANTSAPSPAARTALMRLHEDREQVIHRSALVFPSDGFLAAIVRSIVLSLRQRASRSKGHEVFQRIDKAIHWATADLPTRNHLPIPVAALMLALESFDTPVNVKVA